MRKSILSILALLCAAWSLSAAPAMPGKFTRVLPDGSKVTLELHGDEFRHWLTDESGRVVRFDSRGYLVPSSVEETPVSMGGGEEVNRIRMQQLEKTKRLLRRSAPTRSAVGTIRFPLILVQFPDLSFSVGDTDAAVNAAFDNLANQQGYSAYGATGSIRDYYSANSLGQLDLQFDVYGPVTVSQSYTYYGTKQQSPTTSSKNEPVAQALIEAVRIISAMPGNEHVFDQYDYDGDGDVDALLLYYAGHNEAEHAPANTIYPHQWNLYSYDYYQGTSFHTEKFGNVCFYSYSCTSELRGSSGTTMCGIGTACHEFGHALGLPDFYDTNYDDYGDGKTGALFNYSLMSSGNYNNNGRTPPYFTMEERILMGWVEGDGYTTMPASGTITLPSVSTNFAYKEETGTPGEYFAFECRSATGWDAYISPGLIVYHVDKSDNPLRYYDSGWKNSTAANLWRNHRQSLNTNLEHPCFYIVSAVNRDDLSGNHSTSELPFPGSGHVTTYQWQGWDGDNTQADEFTGISYNATAGTVTLHRAGTDTGVSGLVVNTSGTPVAGATVCAYATYSLPVASEASPSPLRHAPLKVARRMGAPLRTGTTGTDGFYSLTLEGLDLSEVVVEVSAPGYMVKTAPVTLRDRAVVTQDIELRGLGEPVLGSKHKFGPDPTINNRVGFGDNQKPTMLAAVSYTAEELEGYVGCRVMGLQFVYHQGDENAIAGVKGIVDFGTQRHILDVSSPSPDAWTYVDLSDEDLRLPAGETCYFGYALTGCTEGYPCYYSKNDAPVEGGGYMYHTSSSSIPTNVTWWDYSSSRGPMLISVILEEPAVLDYNVIANPRAGNYHTGDSLDLDLVAVAGDRAPGTVIDWYFDDEPVSGTVTLSRAGKHTLEARFTTRAGKRKVVELSITVQ